MKSFLKYFLTAFIAMAATAYLINLYAPFLFEVPKKDKELIKIDFQSEKYYLFNWRWNGFKSHYIV